MEKNNFNKAYVYIIAIFAIGIAISNIISFFNGVGFALIASCLLLTLSIVNILKDENNKKRFGDIFILIALEMLMMIVLFFAYDFNINGITNKFPLVMRNICAIYSMFAFGYVIFRYVSEVKGKKYNFVEYMLGNHVPTSSAKKENKVKLSKEEIKKNKELENGTLEPKPSSIENVANEQNNIEQSKEIDGPQEVLTKEDGANEPTEENTVDKATNTNNINNRTDIW